MDDDSPFLTKQDYQSFVAERDKALEAAIAAVRKVERAEEFVPPHMRAPRPDALIRQLASEEVLRPPRKGSRGIRDKWGGRPTWGAIFIDVLKEANHCLSYREMRDRLGRVLPEPLTERVFHRVLYNLHLDKRVVRHKEHVFLPEHYEAHVAAVARGEIEELTPSRNAGGPLAPAIIKALTGRGWVSSAELLAEISLDPEIKQITAKSQTQFYNTLARMVSRATLLKDPSTKTYKLPARSSVENENGPAFAEPSVSGAPTPLNGGATPNGRAH